MPDWSKLAGSLEGRLIVPGEADSVLALKQFSSGQTLPRPEALIRCGTAEDIKRAFDFVRANGIRFSVRGGGHCFGDLSHCETAMIDLSLLRNARLQSRQKGIGSQLVLEPGACAEHVVPALSDAGLAIPTGGCPTVALGGLSLAGGFGLFGRWAGLATDNVERLMVLVADGSVVEASPYEHADLYRALRGGGTGGLGIVVETVMRTHPLQPAIACHGHWSIDRAEELLAWWQEWAPEAPPQANIGLALVAPGDDAMAAVIELYGMVLAVGSYAQVLASLEEGIARLGARLRTWKLNPAEAAAFACGLLDHSGRPAWQPSRPFPSHGYQFTHSQFFETPIEKDALCACLEILRSDRVYAEHREIELAPWGGAYALGQDTAFVHRNARLLVRHSAMLGARATPELREHAKRWSSLSYDALAPYANGHAYQGYADLTLSRWQSAYYGEAYPALRQVKQRYDPDNVFRHAQSIELP